MRNERPFIAACLDSVLASDYPSERLEIIVVDGTSDDGTRTIVEAYEACFAPVRLLENPKRITPAALNVGIAAARGEIILRLDAHASIERDYISQCVEWLASSGAENVGGVLRTIPRRAGLGGEAIALALGHPFGVGNSAFRAAPPEPRWVDTVFGGCYRREVFERLGGFNERLPRGQDLEFNLRLKRAGGRTLLVPSIRCDYFARTDWRSFCEHNFTNGVWAIRPFLESDIVPVRPRHLVPLVFVLAIGASVAASLSGLGTRLLSGLFAAYFALALGAAGQAGWQGRRWRPALLLPAVFLSLHLAYGLGSLWALAAIAWEAPGRAVRRLRKASRPSAAAV